MEWIGSGRKASVDEIVQIAVLNKIDSAALRAVLAVETNGAGFDVKKRLVILPEPHIFYDRLSNIKQREQAVDEGLAYLKWGTKPYDKTQDLRYARLDRMMKINAEVALKSVSWGLPQMMGFNHAAAGFPQSVVPMIETYKLSEIEQIESMIDFIRHNGLIRHLQNLDWARFAKGYNGPGYEKNEYDKKLARYYKQFNTGAIQATTDPLKDGMLSVGDRGDVVQELQEVLAARGFNAGGFDGAFGKLTDQAVREYQSDNKLVVDGRVGPKTAKTLKLSWAA
jgi:hypothetical protein